MDGALNWGKFTSLTGKRKVKMTKLKKIEVFSGYLGEAVFLAISLGLFSIIFKEDFLNMFFNNPTDWSNDDIVLFYILFFLGIFFLILHAAFKTALKFMSTKKE